MMSVQTFRSCPGYWNFPRVPNSQGLTASGATGHSLTIDGFYVVPIVVAGKLYQQTFMVADNLTMPAILGIDFMEDVGVTVKGSTVIMPGEPDRAYFNMNRRERVDAGGCVGGVQGVPEELIRVATQAVIPAQHHTFVPVRCEARAGEQGLVEVIGQTNDLIVVFDECGKCNLPIANLSAEDVTLARGAIIGRFRPWAEVSVVSEDMFGQESKPDTPPPPPAWTSATPLSHEQKLQFIAETAQVGGDVAERQQVLDLLARFHEVVSSNKFDLGFTDVVKHRIRMIDDRPVHVQQFQIPFEQEDFLNEYVRELLAKGCIQVSRSPYNSPLFCVKKADGSLRVVQDMRAVNEASYDDKYVFRGAQSCIDEIGKAGSRVYSTLDMTSGYWQLALEKGSREKTSFSIAGQPRYEWLVTPMGLKGAGSSFSRMMDYVFQSVKSVLTYLDDVLCHSKDFRSHLRDLEATLQQFARFNLKLNLKKCHFNMTRVPYLGFVLTEDGVEPGEDKMEALRNMKAPATVKAVREFCGLANFFRHMISGFSVTSAALHDLTKFDSGWSKGTLPPKAMAAFKKLRRQLCEKPVVAYPRNDRPFVLATDAAMDTSDAAGGLGAVLMQEDNRGQLRVVSYASRPLRKHEKNYSAYLVELQACVWGVEHFRTYLWGKRFVLQTDHRPVEKMTKVHSKTLNRLQQLMNEFSFTVEYRPGKDNTIADCLSRNVAREQGTVKAEDEVKANVSLLPIELNSLIVKQREDELCAAMMHFVNSRRLPIWANKKQWTLVKMYGQSGVMLDGVLHKIVHQKGMKDKFLVWLPTSMTGEAIKAAHCGRFAGHGGLFRTLQGIQKSFWWPSMSGDVAQFIKSCNTCLRCKDPQHFRSGHAEMQPWEVPDMPNQRVHIDLMGGLKTTKSGKKYILVMTDAHSKWTEVVAIEDKSAAVVAKAFFERWVCRFSCPLLVVSDAGKEFLNKLLAELMKLLEVERRSTSSFHPQTNSSAESYNRSVIKYMRAALEGQTLEWEQLLPAMQLSYNTKIHKSTLASPFFLTFLHDPRMPYFDMDEPRQFEKETWPVRAFRNLQEAYRLAHDNNSEARDAMKLRADKTNVDKQFQVGDPVLVHFQTVSAPAKNPINPKFLPKWQDGFVITKLLGPVTYLVHRRNRIHGKGSTVHADRLKYDSSSELGIESEVTFPKLDATRQRTISTEGAAAAVKVKKKKKKTSHATAPSRGRKQKQKKSLIFVSAGRGSVHQAASPPLQSESGESSSCSSGTEEEVSDDDDDDDDDEETNVFESPGRTPAGLPVLEEVPGDTESAHSSWGGLFGRMGRAATALGGDLFQTQTEPTVSSRRGRSSGTSVSQDLAPPKRPLEYSARRTGSTSQQNQPEKK